MSPSSQWKVDKFTFLGNTLSRAVHSYEEAKTGLLKPVQHLAVYMVKSGIEVESGWIQSWKSTKLQYCQHSYMHVKPGRFTSVMLKDLTTSTRCLWRLLKIRWHDKVLDTAYIHLWRWWTGYVTRMPERFPKRTSGELQVGNRSKDDQKKCCKDTLKPSFKGVGLPTKSWEETSCMTKQSGVAS